MKLNSVTHSKIGHHRLKWVLSLALIVFAGMLSWWYLFLRTDVESEDAYVAGNIIPVQALVPGIVTRIGVDNSMPVYTGQWLLSEEQNLTGAQLDKAGANLAEAVRQTKSLFAQANEERAAIVTLNAQKARLQADLARYEVALPSGAVSAQQVSDTRADIAIINSKIVSANAILHKAKVLVVGTKVANNPLVRQARAEFVESYIQCRRSSIFSPVAGYVADRRVQAGEQVKAGQRLMTIVPLDQLWITTNLKETKLARVRTGEAVRIKAYVYGDGITFHGRVVGIEPSGGSTFSLFPANNATGNYIHIVERVAVRISLSAAELKSHPIRPGMSVSVNIDTQNYRALPMLATEVQTAWASYSTPVYQQEMPQAQQAAEKIIKDNDL